MRAPFSQQYNGCKRALPKRLAIAIICMLAGGLCGSALVGYLSVQASCTFVQALMLDYESEQNMLAIRAKTDRDMRSAVHFYRNLAASASGNLVCFSRAQSQWDLFWPVTSLLLRITAKSAHVGPIEEEDSRRIVAGASMAKLAWALEQLGERSEADSVYTEALGLLPFCADIADVRAFVKGVMSGDEELLRLETLSRTIAESF